jgi:hypothetical protein
MHCEPSKTQEIRNQGSRLSLRRLTSLLLAKTEPLGLLGFLESKREEELLNPAHAEGGSRLRGI